jgi:hypothetical protein
MEKRDRRRIQRAQSREAPMDKINELFLHPFAQYIWRNPEFGKTTSNLGVHIADERVARLLTVLHELDESVAGLEELPNDELSELVCSAITACGFVDPIEARHAIATVLEVIEMHDPVESS